MHEKRKHGARRRLPRWGVMLVVGFALGVVVTLLVVRPPQAAVQGQAVLPTVSDPMFLTATAIVEGATATAISLDLVDHPAVMTAQANQGWIDPLALTATAVVGQATLEAASS